MLRLGPFLQSLGLHLIFLLIILLLSHFLPQGKSEPLFLDLTSYQLEEREDPQARDTPSKVKHKVKENPKKENPTREVKRHEPLLSEASPKAIYPVEEKVYPVKEEQPSNIASEERPLQPAESFSLAKHQSAQSSSGSPIAKEPHQGSSQSSRKEVGEGKEVTQEVYLKRNLSVIAEIVRRHLGYPYLARRMGWQGNLIITFVLTPKGEIRDLSIEKSSGYEVLDKNTLEVLKKTAPFFPQPPVEVKIRLPVRYVLN